MSLTQAEAMARSALIAVGRYDIEIDLTAIPVGPDVRCISTTTFSCRHPGETTFVDCAADVVTATLNGAELGPAIDGRITLPELAAQNVLRVETVQGNTAEGEGVHKAVDPADGAVYLWTSFEPDEARHVWACFDQPDLKAPHTFVVTAPAEWTVVSNSGDPIVETIDAARRWTFPPTPPLSVYNTVVNAGPFHEIRRTAGGYDLGIFARRSLAVVLERDADEIFTLTEQFLGFFADVFGMPFPQRKYDQVFVPEMGGAMENYGCVTWSDAYLRRSTPTPAERELFAMVLLHEAAHMWFGNIVTMRWWDDLWLNEAFAEFACHWAAVNATAYTDAWAGHLASGKLAAYLADQGPMSHPIHQPIPDVAAAAAIFDAITYPKGASVLHQLMIYVGEDNFVRGMTAYFAEHAWGNTTLHDLFDALAAASGRDLEPWRTGWLATAGTDRLTLEQSADELVLVAHGPAGPPRPQVLAVGAYRRADHRLERIALARCEVTGPRTRVDLPAGADLYLLNDDDLTFATTRPDPAVRDELLASAGDFPTATARAVVVATAWDMLVTGEASAAEAVGCLTAVLAVETSDSVIEPFLILAADISDLWAPAADRPKLIAAVAAAARQVANAADRRLVALRILARTAPDLDTVAQLQDEIGANVDLQWRALVRKAQLGGETGRDIERLRAIDPDPDAHVRAAAVRAATADAGAKHAAWQQLAIERSIPIGSMSAITSAFWSPGQDELLAPYADRYLELLPELGRSGMIPAMVYSGRLFPIFGIDGSFIDQAEAAATQAVPVVGKTVRERADVMRRMLRSRG